MLFWIFVGIFVVALVMVIVGYYLDCDVVVDLNMTCVRKIYAPHKWWQFWKWRKLVGYEMRYYKE